MRLRSADVVPYGGAVSGARGAVERWPERRGLLLRLIDSDGRVAQGEASPLPRYSRDTLDAARSALARFDWGALPDAETGEPAWAYLSRLASCLDAAPAAARFALETALLDRLGQQRDLPIWALLGGSRPPEPVPLSFLAGGAEDATTVTRARSATERGVGTVKVKLAGPRLETQLSTLRLVREAIGDLRLRLDANGSLDEKSAVDELERLVAVDPELVEEPVEPRALAALGPSPVRLGLDESLQDPQAFERLVPHLERLQCVAVVLKPMALGGFAACHRLAERAEAARLDVTVSHLFDGPVALTAAAHLALAIASRSRASGLDAHGGLTAWPETRLPVHHPTSIVAGYEAGLGLAPLAGQP